MSFCEGKIVNVVLYNNIKTVYVIYKDTSNSENYFCEILEVTFKMIINSKLVG